MRSYDRVAGPERRKKYQTKKHQLPELFHGSAMGSYYKIAITQRGVRAIND
jgi:hypothetical protein